MTIIALLYLLLTSKLRKVPIELFPNIVGDQRFWNRTEIIFFHFNWHRAQTDRVTETNVRIENVDERVCIENCENRNLQKPKKNGKRKIENLILIIYSLTITNITNLPWLKELPRRLGGCCFCNRKEKNQKQELMKDSCYVFMI